jgi:hypothetical protein
MCGGTNTSRLRRIKKSNVFCSDMTCKTSLHDSSFTIQAASAGYLLRSFRWRIEVY